MKMNKWTHGLFVAGLVSSGAIASADEQPKASPVMTALSATTLSGYEAYDTYKDPNWSRSYGFYIESSAHTGVSASYKVSDAITLMAAIGNEAGFNNQVDARQATESRKAYLTMITLTAPESMGFLKGATLSGGYTVGASAPAYGAWNQGNI